MSKINWGDLLLCAVLCLAMSVVGIYLGVPFWLRFGVTPAFACWMGWTAPPRGKMRWDK